MRSIPSPFSHDFLKGGPGSGNFGHRGRPGQHGGSSSSGGGERVPVFSLDTQDLRMFNSLPSKLTEAIVEVGRHIEGDAHRNRILYENRNENSEATQPDRPISSWDEIDSSDFLLEQLDKKVASYTRDNFYSKKELEQQIDKAVDDWLSKDFEPALKRAITTLHEPGRKDRAVKELSFGQSLDDWLSFEGGRGGLESRKELIDEFKANLKSRIETKEGLPIDPDDEISPSYLWKNRS